MVICLARDAALDRVVGPHSGKGSGELALVRRLLEGFRPGNVMHRRCPVLQLFPDRHADGRRCGTPVGAVCAQTAALLYAA